LLRSGDVFAGFTIEHLVGQGGMGSVYLARHPRLQRQTALKLLNRELYADKEIRARFEREANLVAQLDHPNIVEVYDRGIEDEQLWISMQYVDGVDAATVNPLTLPPARAVQIIEGVGAALDYAHGNGVLHRDVKPANILLGRAVGGKGERVYLTDFGIARLREDSTHLTQDGMFTATLAYASPEQMTGSPLDNRSDQYALGCALYWLLCGAGPFDSEDANELIHGHLQLPVPPISARRAGLNPAMDLVLARSMAKRAADRFATCSEFAAAAKHALTAPKPAAVSVPGGGYPGMPVGAAAAPQSMPPPAPGVPLNGHVNPVAPSQPPNQPVPQASSVPPVSPAAPPLLPPNPTGFPPNSVLLQRDRRRSPNALLWAVLGVVVVLVVVVAGFFMLSGGPYRSTGVNPGLRQTGPTTGTARPTGAAPPSATSAPGQQDPVTAISRYFPTLLPQGDSSSGDAYQGRVACERSTPGQPGKVLQTGGQSRRSDPLAQANRLGAWECTSRQTSLGYAIVVFDTAANAQAALAAVPPNTTASGSKGDSSYSQRSWAESDDEHAEIAEMVVSFDSDPARATAVLYAYDSGSAVPGSDTPPHEVLAQWWDKTPL
jgi:eukaryotic-like serine/threonine-protein kinase